MTPWPNEPTCTIASGYAPPPIQWSGGHYPLHAPYDVSSARNALPHASCLPLPLPNSQASQGLHSCIPTAFDQARLAAPFPEPADQETFAPASIWDTQAYWQPPLPSSVMALESPLPESTFTADLVNRSWQVVDVPQPDPGVPFDTPAHQTLPIFCHPHPTPLQDATDLPFTDAPLSLQRPSKGAISDTCSGQLRRPESRSTGHDTSDSSDAYLSWPQAKRTKQRVACQGCRGQLMHP